MRWKLLLIAALVTAPGNAAFSFGAFKLFNRFESASSRVYFIISTAIFIVAAITYASIFVYRHNARRRKLQALLTGLFAFILTAALVALLVQLKILPQLFS